MDTYEFEIEDVVSDVVFISAVGEYLEHADLVVGDAPDLDDD